MLEHCTGCIRAVLGHVIEQCNKLEYSAVLDPQVKQLKQVNHSLGLELQPLKSEVASLRAKRSDEASLQQSALLEKMKTKHRKEVEQLIQGHANDIEALTSQIDSLRNNQRGFDAVGEELKVKQVEIKTLQDTITRMKVCCVPLLICMYV